MIGHYVFELSTRVSLSTATDLMYDKVGGTEPVNQLMRGWGLNSIRATGTADDWFKALRAAGTAEVFHQQAKTPFGLSSPRDMGRLLEKMEKGEAVSKGAATRCCRSCAASCTVRGCRDMSRASAFRTRPAISCPTSATTWVFWRAIRGVVMSVFTAKHFGAGVNLEDAIGRIAEVTANYFGAAVAVPGHAPPSEAIRLSGWRPELMNAPGVR